MPVAANEVCEESVIVVELDEQPVEVFFVKFDFGEHGVVMEEGEILLMVWCLFEVSTKHHQLVFIENEAIDVFSSQHLHEFVHAYNYCG